MLEINDRKRLQQNSNPTVALNFIGVLRAFARNTGTSLADVIVEASGNGLYVHAGWPSENVAQNTGPDVFFGLRSRYDATDVELEGFSADHIDDHDGVVRLGLPSSHEIVPVSLMRSIRKHLGDGAWDAVVTAWQAEQDGTGEP